MKAFLFKRKALKPELKFIFLLVLLILAIFWRLTFLQAIPGEEDNFTFNFPYKAVFSDFLKKSELPLWNPYAAFGFPQYAQAITAAFYLPDLILFRFLPLIPAFNYALLFHLIMIAVFTFLFARSLGISPQGSFLTAFIFTFCGWILGLLGAVQNFYPLTWFPITLWLIELYFQKRKAVYLCLSALTLASSILASFPQITLYVIYACSFYYFWRLFSFKSSAKFEKPKAIGLLNWLLIVTLAAGLSSVWLLPLLEVVKFSPRAEGVNTAYAQQGSFNPLFLTFNIYPNLLLGKYGVIGRYICLYIGILPLLFSFFSLKDKRNNSTAIFFIILLIFSLLLSLGKYNPLYWLFLNLPGFSFFRQPWRILFLFEFSLAILAGFGFENLSSKNKTKNLLVVSLLLIAAIVPVIVLFTKPYLIKLLPESKMTLALNNLQPISLLLPVTFLFMTAISILLYQKRFLTLHSFKNLALLVIVLDLSLFGWQGRAFDFFSIKKYRDYFYNSAGGNFLKNDRGIYRIYSLPVPHEDAIGSELYPSKENYWRDLMNLLLTSNNMLFKVQSIAQSDFALGLQSTIKINEIVEGEKAEGHQYDPLAAKKLEELSKLLGFLNVKYVLAKETINPSRYRLVNKDKWYKIYQNLDFMPRAIVITNFSRISKPLIPEIKSLKTDLRLSKYLDANLQNQNFKATILKYESTEVIIGVKTEKKGYLLLTDTYYPGWKATVNGKEAKIYLSDYVFRAVKIPAGESVVKFRFEPESFKKGLLVSLASLLTWAILFLVSLRKGRICL